MDDVNVLVRIMATIADADAAKAYLANLQAVSQKVYDDLRATAIQADANAARESILNDKEVILSQREAALNQREIDMRNAEGALADKLTALRNLVA